MLLNFKDRFRIDIENGDKRHTIRAKRKRRPRVGETCHNYTGLRTKKARLIFRAPCIGVEDIRITARTITIGDNRLSSDEAEAFARADGFRYGHSEMMRFWRRYNKLPFNGDVIHWDYTKRGMKK